MKGKIRTCGYSFYGMTKLQLLRALALQLGYRLVKK